MIITCSIISHFISLPIRKIGYIPNEVLDLVVKMGNFEFRNTRQVLPNVSPVYCLRVPLSVPQHQSRLVPRYP